MASTQPNTPNTPASAPAPTSAPQSKPFVSKWSARYRGATVEDLEPPAALSLTPTDSISTALLTAFERDYTHLTVIDGTTRALLGYVSIPQLQTQLGAGRVSPDDPISSAMARFRRKGRPYTVITMETPLEQLEEFFGPGLLEDGSGNNHNNNNTNNATDGGVASKDGRDFAVVTDAARRFVLGVATRADLEEFIKRRIE